MAKIVAVHGIGQQFSGDAIIHREWWPALISGLHLADSDLKDERELLAHFTVICSESPGVSPPPILTGRRTSAPRKLRC